MIMTIDPLTLHRVIIVYGLIYAFVSGFLIALIREDWIDVVKYGLISCGVLSLVAFVLLLDGRY